MVKNFTCDINVDGSSTVDDRYIIDSPSSTTELEFGYFTDGPISGYGVRLVNGGGLFRLMSSALFPQLLLGADNNTTGSAFIDVDNNRPLNINTLDTGPGIPGLVTIGEGGLDVLADSAATSFTLTQGANSIQILPSGTLSSSYSLVLPLDDGDVGQVLTTDGNGVLDWADISTTFFGLDDVDVTTNVPVAGNGFYWNGSNVVPMETSTDRVLYFQNGCIAEFIDTTGLDFCNTQIGPTAGSAFYLGKRALGTIAAPTAILGGTKISGYGMAGFNDTDFIVSAEIAGYAIGDYTGTNTGSRLEFLVTTQNSITPFAAFQIFDDGSLSVAGNPSDYETLVVDDDDIPNKKYVDDLPKRTWVWSVARNAANQPNQFLRRQNGTPTNQCPYTAYTDCTLYAATAENDPSDTTAWTLAVEVNGVQQYTLVKTAGNNRIFDDAASVDINQNDAVTIRMINQAGPVDRPGASIYLIER